MGLIDELTKAKNKNKTINLKVLDNNGVEEIISGEVEGLTKKGIGFFRIFPKSSTHNSRRFFQIILYKQIIGVMR